MTSVAIPRSADILMLKTILGALPSEPAVLRLYVNDVTPDALDTAARYREPAGSGYRAIPLDATAWKMVEAEGGAFEATYPEQTFEFSAALEAPVHGYFLTQAKSGRLLWAVRFERTADGDDPPYRMRRRGDRIFVQPALQFGP